MAADKAVLVFIEVGYAIDLVNQPFKGNVFKSNDLQDLMQKLGN